MVRMNNISVVRIPLSDMESSILITIVSIKALGPVRLCNEITLGYMNVSIVAHKSYRPQRLKSVLFLRP